MNLSFLKSTIGLIVIFSFATVAKAQEGFDVDYWARELNADRLCIVLAESKSDLKPDDFRLSDGSNLLNAEFMGLMRSREVKMLHTIAVLRGDPSEVDRIIVFREKTALTKNPCFLPAPGSRYLVAFKKVGKENLRIDLGAESTGRRSFAVLELADRGAGICAIPVGVDGDAFIEDLRELKVSMNEGRGLSAQRWRSEAGKKLGEKLASLKQPQGPTPK